MVQGQTHHRYCGRWRRRVVCVVREPTLGMGVSVPTRDDGVGVCLLFMKLRTLANPSDISTYRRKRTCVMGGFGSGV
jgi:hypothetical protein